MFFSASPFMEPVKRPGEERSFANLAEMTQRKHGRRLRGAGFRLALCFNSLCERRRFGCRNRNRYGNRYSGCLPLTSFHIPNGAAHGVLPQEGVPSDWDVGNDTHDIPFGNDNLPISPNGVQFGSSVVDVENPNLSRGPPVENGGVQDDSPTAPRTAAQRELEFDQIAAFIREFFFVDHGVTIVSSVRRYRVGSNPCRGPAREIALPPRFGF